MNLLSQFEILLNQSRLIFPGDKILIACSGGPDSTALLHLFRFLVPSWKLKIGVLHYDHGWRGKDSQKDARWVEKLCANFHIPCTVGQFSARQKKNFKKNKLSLEEAARKARYDYFLNQAKTQRVDKLVTAHTLEDQAETILMRIVQGTGLAGLCGIRPVVALRGRVKVIRPMLSFSKKEILCFLKEHHFSFRIDATNRSNRFLRNRIRSQLIPLLEHDFNPRVVHALARVPHILGEEQEILEGFQSDAWKKVFKKNAGGRIYLDRQIFLNFGPALQYRLLNKALQKVDVQSGLNYRTWNELRKALTLKRYRHSLKKDVDLFLTPSRIVLYKK
ncbi:MAG: tRNA lysidine(34) synthetase TilS [Candidatus Omnitrophica bacterium]|nr:tRNA lysidine(34) synthetase TilS [Candidatus Omnitrophota bacterium]